MKKFGKKIVKQAERTVQSVVKPVVVNQQLKKERKTGTALLSEIKEKCETINAATAQSESIVPVLRMKIDELQANAIATNQAAVLSRLTVIRDEDMKKALAENMTIRTIKERMDRENFVKQAEEDRALISAAPKAAGYSLSGSKQIAEYASDRIEALYTTVDTLATNAANSLNALKGLQSGIEKSLAEAKALMPATVSVSADAFAAMQRQLAELTAQLSRGQIAAPAAGPVAAPVAVSVAAAPAVVAAPASAAVPAPTADVAESASLVRP